MSIESCLGRLVSQGKISEQQANDARAIYRNVLNDDMLRDMDRATAEGYAALKTAEILEDAAKQRKITLSQKLTAYNSAVDRIDAHPTGPVAGFIGMYDRDAFNKGAGREGQPLDRQNVSAMEEDFRGRIAQKMHVADEAYASKASGLRQDVMGIRKMVYEIFGVKTSDQLAAAAAKGWKEATDWATQKAQALGKVFEPQEGWRLPQWWTAARVNKIGRSVFVADMKAAADRGAVRIFDPEAAKFVTGADRDRVINAAADHIAMDLSRKAGPGTVFKNEQRVFQFVDGQKGADAYLHFMDKYGPGRGGYFSMLQAHAQRMARELGLLHVWGPEFRSTAEQALKYAIEQDAKLKLDAPQGSILDRIGNTIVRGLGQDGRVAAERLHKYMTGQLSGVESDLVAGVFEGARSLMIAANLGSAIVTAVPSDAATWVMAANFRGLNGGRLAQAITDTFLHDTPDKGAFAARLGITSHAASRVAIATRTFGDQIMGDKLPQRLADFVVRSQGLTAYDTALKRSFTMEFLASIGDHAGKSWDDLDAPFQGFFRDYGFSPDEWNALSKAPTWTVGPTRYLTPDGLEEGLRSKLMSAIYDERQFGYLAAGTNKGRALATGGAKGGTMTGEAARSFFSMKSFPITMLTTWGMRAAQEAKQGRFGTALQIALYTTLAGALSLQAKQVLMGKDPEDMGRGWFWEDAALQGGALGIYGDFIRQGFSRSGTSLEEAALGPLGEILPAIQDFTSGARREAETGQKMNWGGALANDLQRFPPGSSLWYARLGLNRMIVDNIRRMVDPNYAQSFQRAKDYAEKNYGQQYWWAPGDDTPARAPDAGAAVGSQPGG